MTKQEWEEFEKLFAGRFGSAALIIGEDLISFSRELTGTNKLGIITYINGSFKGAWFITKEGQEPAPELKYFNHGETFKYSQKQRALIKKESKKFTKKFWPDVDEKIPQIRCFFSSGQQVRRQYQKRFGDENITLVTD